MFRKIKTTVVSWFSKKPAAEPTVPDYYQVALNEVGIKEIAGTGDAPRIIEYHSATSLKSTDDEVAWCSSFVNWCLMKTRYERSNSAAARSWLGQGKRLSKFKAHTIVVFRRGNSSWQGHVGFAVSDHGSVIRVLGGNQGNAVSFSNYSKSDVLGYIEPKKL